MTPLEQCVPEEKEVVSKESFSDKYLGKTLNGKILKEIISVAKANSWNACRQEMLRRIAALNKENDVEYI